MTRSVLVVVLDWGLGHATRCVPVIRELLHQNFRVVIGGSGASLQFLKDEFQELKFYDLPSYNIKYPMNGNLVRSLVFQLPRIFRVIEKENRLTQEIIEKENIDCVISDNRYGCYSAKIKSIFICHQLNLQMPDGFQFLSGIVNALHIKRIKKFDEVWIPDEREGFRFSGILSENKLNNVKYVGILSRFGSQRGSTSKEYEIAALVSGPEPQRTIFEKMLKDQLTNLNKNCILIKGKPDSISKMQSGLLTEVDHLDSGELESVLMNSSVVVSRSGYSTIMDMAALGKKVILVPTPGQTEQEYLAKNLRENQMAIAQSQKDFSLKNAVAQLRTLLPLTYTKPNSSLKKSIQELINNN